MALREILAEFTTKVDGVGLEKLDKKIEGVKGNLEKLMGVFAGAFVGNEIKEFFLGQIEAGDALVDLADKLGLATDELQQFQYGAGIFGVQAEDAARSLGFLNKNVGEAVGGNKEAVKAFQELGVKVKESNGDVRELGDLIPDIADAFAGMKSQQERTTKAMSLFGKSGAALLPFLKDGSKGVEALNKEFEDLGGGLSKEFLEQADKTGDQLFRLDFAMKGLKGQIASALAPTILNIATKFIVWVKSVRELVEQTNFVKTFTIAVAALGVALLPVSIEFIAIAAAAAVAYLIFDDIFTLFTGGESVIGNFLDKMGGVGTSAALVKDVKDAVEELNKAWESTGISMKEVGAVGKWLFEFIVGAVAQLIEWFGALVRGITTVVKVFSPDKVARRTGESEIATAIAPSKPLPAVESWQKDMRPGTLLRESAAEAEKQAQLAINERAQATGLANASTFSGKETIGGVAPTTAFGPPVAPGKGGPPNLSQVNQVQVTVQAGSNPQETGRNVATGVRDGMKNSLKDAFAATASN